MPRPLLLSAVLAALLFLAACSGAPASGSEAELRTLRQRLETLERGLAEDGARRDELAGEVRALRQELADLRAARGPDAGPGVAPAPPLGPDTGQAQHSPRQALKESLGHFVDMTRQALDRLVHDLDQSLVRPGQPEAPARPGKPGGPTAPEAPGGTRI